ncbi:MAG: DNA internalization-related competence protein ComEC/Rec2 [Oscillospiraceae bacterium]|nr:DNA internalization-related competence protein ComEC/Rec2 [Oscillospiraceae bacterium]
MNVRKLVWLGLGYALALLLCAYALPEGWMLPAGGVCLLLGGAALALRRIRWRTPLALALLAAALGFGWYWGYVALTVRPAEAYVGQTRTLRVLVTEYPERYPDYARVTVRSLDARFPRTRILVYDYDEALGDLRPGDTAEMQLFLRSAGERYGQESDAYYAAGVFLRANLNAPTQADGRHPLSWLFLPKELAAAIQEQALLRFPPDVAGLMKALLTGDRQEYYQDEELSAAMQSAGFSHIVAVSGMHVGFLVSVVRLLTRRRRRTAALGIPAVALFMAMIGFTPSVTRAGIMQILLLVAPLLQREEDAPSALAAAGLVLGLVNPMAIASLSLQFSFAAMAGLLLVTPGLYRRLCFDKHHKLRWTKRFWGRPLRGLCAAFSASLGALVFTAPLSALHYGSVPVYGLFTNLLCLWLMSAAFVLGFAVCLLGLLWPAGATAAGWVLAWLPRCVIWVVRRVARLPFALLYTEGNLAAWWLVFVYLVFLIPLAVRGKRFRPVIPACAALVSFCLLSFCFRTELDGQLEVAALDVGQGQCIVALSGDATVMIDCGSADYSVQAGDVAAAYLASRGRRRVDLLILSHFHGDHVNGVRRLLSHVEVARAVIPDAYQDNEYDAAILDAFARSGTELYRIAADRRFDLGTLEIQVFAPIGVGEVNEECLLVAGDYGDFEFLVPADVGAGVERMLCLFYDLGNMELLVAGHHGARTSSTEELLDAITPETVFISCGANNRYGHPAPETLARLAARHISVWRTDLDGTVSLTVGREHGESEE